MLLFWQKNISLLPILGLALFLLSINVDKKFIGQHDWNSVWYASIARNLLRYDLKQTKLGSFPTSGPVVFSKNIYFTHYPPLFPLILAGAMKVVGENESGLRTVITVFSLFTLVFTYLISEELFDKSVAFLASIFTAVTPMFLYYGKLPVHETVLLPWLLSCIYFYIRWLKVNADHYFWKLVISGSIGLLISWPAYFVALFLLLHSIIIRAKKEHIRRLWKWLGMTGIIFSLHFVHVWFLTGSLLGGGLIEIFRTRISSEVTNKQYNLTFFTFVFKEVRYVIIYLTKIIAALSGLWYIKELWKVWSSKHLPLATSIMGVLLGIGIAYPLIFREAAFLHDYLIYYLMPSVVISAAVFLDKVIALLPSVYLKKLAVLILVLIVAWERKDFTVALLASNQSEKGYILGNFIRQETNFNDRIFVGSSFYGQFFSPFISFYGDRVVNYGEKIPLAELGNYDLIIRPKAHDALTQEIKFALEQDYPRYENQQFIWYRPH